MKNIHKNIKEHENKVNQTEACNKLVGEQVGFKTLLKD